MPTFGLPANYDLSYGPLTVDTGDFNRDGHVDLVSSGVAVWLNNGNGTLAGEVLYPVGAGAVVVGDLNSDGNLDVVTTTLTFEAVHVKVLLGDGTGAFAATAATSDLADGRASRLALGDLDGDGDLDLVASNLDGGASVLLGNGDGTFAARRDPAVGVPTRDVDLADLDGDGHLDLIGASAFSNVVRVLLGNGNGTFQAAQTAFTATGIYSDVTTQAVGDVNGDGTLDLAVGADVWYGDDYYGHSEPRVQVLLGHGDGTFTEGNSYLAGGYLTDVELADVTGDGRPDLVAGAGYVNLLRGNGDGTFHTAEVFPVGLIGGGPNDVAVADFDGNGAPDVATANYGSNTISVLLNGVDPLPRPALGISDVTVGEGNTGTRAATFTVTLSAASSQFVTVAYITADGVGSATAGSDYLSTSGTLTFAPGEVSKTITVAVLGDTIFEPNETVYVNLSSPNYATIADGQGMGTIVNDDLAPPPPPAPPTLRVSDATVTEGNAGTVAAVFTVTLSAASSRTVVVTYTTGAGTATVGDYGGASGTLTFAPGETRKTVTVLVNGDRLPEANETFFVNLSGPTGATIADGQGAGTIVDDEPRISVSDVTRKEGNGKKTTLLTFTVTLSAAYDQPVTMSYRTVNGTATTTDGDYIAKTGTLTFAPGETTKAITVEVKGDTRQEADETFFLDLFGNSGNSLFTRFRGLGTILNDD